MENSKRIPYAGFCGPTYNQVARQASVSIDRAINLYTQQNEVGTPKDANPIMICRPGLVTFSTPGLGVGRGLFILNMTIAAAVVADQFAGCSGTKFFTINNSTGVTTVRGDIGSGTFPCIAFANVQGTQVAILNINTGQLYFWDGATVATVATPIGFYSMAYLDGYAYGVGNGNKIYQSGLNDFTTWDPLEFATRLDASDFVQTLFAQDDALDLLGQQTTSFWGNTGQAGFALAGIQGSMVQNGIGAPFSVVTADYLTNTAAACVIKSKRGGGQVAVLRQGKMDRISTHAIELMLQRLSSTYDLIGSSFQLEGHSYYSLTGVANTFQIVYDFTNDSWSEWGSGATGLGEMPAFYIGLGIVTGSGTGQEKLFGMRQSDGKIFRLDPTVRSDDGTAFLCERIPPVLYDLGHRITINEFRVDQQLGDGLGSTGAGAQISYDGGLTWVNAVTGVANTYGTVTAQADGSVEWRSLGQADQRGFAIKVAWPSTALLSVSGAALEITVDEP